MLEQPEPNVGQRIRSIRERNRLSLRALAEKADLSLNAISLIEKGENSPTVSSLHLLAKALDVPVTAFFEEAHQKTVVYVRPEQRLHSNANGIDMESLGIGLRNQQIEPFLMTIEPGAGITGEPVTHPGEEFVHCLEGEVEYHVEEQTYLLQANFSMLFDATQPHWFRNSGLRPALLLIIFCAGEASHVARQRHLDPRQS